MRRRKINPKPFPWTCAISTPDWRKHLPAIPAEMTVMASDSESATMATVSQIAYRELAAGRPMPAIRPEHITCRPSAGAGD